jgi:hypothetical protein
MYNLVVATTGKPPTDHDMDQFYRQFLLENKLRHRQYQQWWLHANVAMLTSVIRQYLRRLWNTDRTTATTIQHSSNK